MSEIYYVDLLALLRAFKGKLDNCTLYGRIVKEVSYPAVIQPGVTLSDVGAFCVMEVFAVNVGKYATYLKENGVHNKDGVYMVNGNVLVYANKAQIKGVDWYQVSGTIRLPSSKNVSGNCVAMLNFFRDNQKWCLSPCRVADLDYLWWSPHSEALAWLNGSASAGSVKHPPEVMRLPRFEYFDQSNTPVPKSTAQEPPAMQPAYGAQPVTSVMSRFTKENRQVVRSCSPQVGIWDTTLRNSESAKKAYIDGLLEGYSKNSYNDEYLKYMLKGIIDNFSRKRTNYSMTGRAVVKKYLETNKLSREDYIGVRTVGEYLADNFREMTPFILDNSQVVNADGVALEVCQAMFGDKEAFYAGIVGVVIGISSDDIDELVSFCSAKGLSLTKIFNENPYALQFFSTLSFDEIERIALCFGKHEDIQLSRYRNTAMLNAFISNPDDGSTVFKKSQLERANIGVRLTKARFDRIRHGETYLTEAMATNIDSFIRDTRSVPLTYMPHGFRQVAGGKFVRSLDKAAIERAVQDYVTSGLGVVQDDYITSSDLLKKELFVFHTMLDMAKKTHPYKAEDIDKCIAEYEELAGFKLEASQVKAVHLLTNSAFVVAGSAGSGKTTVSRCVVHTLRKLSPMLDIKFAAPTGKAAKRMQEVVQEECRTLHSTFRISGVADNVFTEDDRDANGSNTAFFFDESAMITVDLLYKVLRSVDKESARIFLFGDFNQLSPIGKGLPFKNLLRFMPCVFLDVVKRAAEGSNITANSAIVNDHSDMNNWEYLKNGKDFFLLDCGGDRIQNVVRRLCAHYLGKQPDDGTIARALSLDKLPEIPGLTPDDIQVVSPLTKDSYSWGATALNQVLQPLFNPTKSYDKTFIYQVTKFNPGVKFMIGDRVIHTDKNMYSMQWYGSYKAGVFHKVYGQGICNGEVGRVVGFFQADKVKFYEEEEPKPDDFEYTDSLRNDASHCGQNAYFVVVEYYDFISARNFYILYRAERNNSVESNEGIVLKGEDVQKLNLFYAGTTHKLQGSQAKLIIFVLDDVNFGGFITRQMVYTMMTRAEKLCFGVGSVGNRRNSMLSRARMDIASADTLTVGEIVV